MSRWWNLKPVTRCSDFINIRYISTSILLNLRWVTICIILLIVKILQCRIILVLLEVRLRHNLLIISVILRTLLLLVYENLGHPKFQFLIKHFRHLFQLALWPLLYSWRFNRKWVKLLSIPLFYTLLAWASLLIINWLQRPHICLHSLKCYIVPCWSHRNSMIFYCNFITMKSIHYLHIDTVLLLDILLWFVLLRSLIF